MGVFNPPYYEICSSLACFASITIHFLFAICIWYTMFFTILLLNLYNSKIYTLCDAYPKVFYRAKRLLRRIAKTKTLNVFTRCAADAMVQKLCCQIDFYIIIKCLKANNLQNHPLFTTTPHHGNLFYDTLMVYEFYDNGVYAWKIHKSNFRETHYDFKVFQRYFMDVLQSMQSFWAYKLFYILCFRRFYTFSHQSNFITTIYIT